MRQVQAQIRATPAVDIVANHVVQLFELALVYLGVAIAARRAGPRARARPRPGRRGDRHDGRARRRARPPPQPSTSRPCATPSARSRCSTSKSPTNPPALSRRVRHVRATTYVWRNRHNGAVSQGAWHSCRAHAIADRVIAAIARNPVRADHRRAGRAPRE